MTEPTRFLFVSSFGGIMDLARQVLAEGHEARLWIDGKTERNVGDGFVPKVEDWRAHVDWAHVLVFDDVEYGAVCEDLRRKGKAVVGGSVYSDKLELDRDFGQQEMKAVGMTVLPSWDFDSFDAAIEFVTTHPDRYVVKPNGEAQNEKEGVHPCEVRLVDGDWLLSGVSGYALVVTGTANTMIDARKEAYSRVKNILIPNMFYRTDIGERWARDGDLLQSWGMLT